MIGRLRGLVISREPPTALIEVAGIGYEIWMPLNDFSLLPAPNEETVVYTCEQHRDDVPTMFGFASADNKSAFLELIKVSGIGAKSALALLSTFDLGSLADAIAREDKKLISRTPGIGPKSAARLIIDLKNNPALAAAPAAVPVLSHAAEALRALGYSLLAARRALSQLDPAGQDVSSLVKQALKILSSHK